MKLLLCSKCDDVIKLTVGKWRRCECGQTSGRYLEDGDKAEVSEGCIVLGINSTSLSEAVRHRNDDALRTISPSLGFSAFVFGDYSDKIRRRQLNGKDRIQRTEAYN